jgi:hypothetical protein
MENNNNNPNNKPEPADSKTIKNLINKKKILEITNAGSGYTSSPIYSMSSSMYGGPTGIGNPFKESADKQYYNFEKMLREIMAEFKNDPAVLSAVLKNADLHKWWGEECERVKKEEARKAALEEKARLRTSALAKLTSEEKRALGINDDSEEQSLTMESDFSKKMLEELKIKEILSNIKSDVDSIGKGYKKY